MTRQPPSPPTHAGESTAESAILITVDSLRADAVDLDPAGLTPSMAQLAADGTLCTNAFAGGNWTPFSFPSILASSPVFTRDGDIGVTGAATLASVLTDAGFTTAGFNAANGFLTGHWGYDRGFDQFDPHVTADESSLYGRYLATHPTVEAWLQLATAPLRRLRSKLSGAADSRPFLDTSRMFAVEESAQRFISETEGPFFLWLHYMDAHTPYVPAPRYIRDVSAARIGTHRMLLAHTRTGLGREVAPRTLRDLQNLYRAAIRQVDLSIGRVLETLAAAGVERLVLTASGGPFRDRDPATLSRVTVEEACAHPNWSMGRKISVDSATMMNKGLELIEACRFFGAPPTQVDVLVHPQSLVHALVQYRDGSTLAQMGTPDMRTPIANALAWPERINAGVAPLDLLSAGRLDFSAPDGGRFPCLELARSALNAGYGATAALNGANEVAVSAFLDGALRFDRIAVVIEETLSALDGDPENRLDALIDHEQQARREATASLKRWSH